MFEQGIEVATEGVKCCCLSFTSAGIARAVVNIDLSCRPVCTACNSCFFLRVCNSCEDGELHEEDDSDQDGEIHEEEEPPATVQHEAAVPVRL